MKYVVAGNGETHTSSILNNHEEADTLMINVLYLLDPSNQTVIVHANNTDVFAILLCHYEKVQCSALLMKSG